MILFISSVQFPMYCTNRAWNWPGWAVTCCTETIRGTQCLAARRQPVSWHYIFMDMRLFLEAADHLFGEGSRNRKSYRKGVTNVFLNWASTIVRNHMKEHRDRLKDWKLLSAKSGVILQVFVKYWNLYIFLYSNFIKSFTQY